MREPTAARTCSEFSINSEDVSWTVSSRRDKPANNTSTGRSRDSAAFSHTHTHTHTHGHHGRPKDSSQCKVGYGVRPLRGSQGALYWPPPISEGKM
jgi:hypothetical protein